MIKPADLTGITGDAAVRLIVLARSIAPCLDTLEDGPGDDDPKPRAEAIAILNGVAQVQLRPSHIKSERTGPSSAEYFPNSSWFSADDRTALRSLCAAASGRNPIGSFPTSSPLTNVWPEGDYN